MKKPVACLMPLAAAALLVATGAAHAATGVSATTTATTTVHAGGQTATQTLSDAWPAPFSGLHDAAPYASTQDGYQLPGDPHGVTTASAVAGVLADWTLADASQGTVIATAGWELRAQDRAASVDIGSTGAAFDYTFVAGAGETLQIAYTHSGSTLIGWNIQLLGGPEGTRSAASAGTSGSFSAGLTAGATYELRLLSTGGSLSLGAGSGYVYDSARADFNWQIASTTAAVPEPGTATMWLAALGMAGLARRRQRGAARQA